MTLNLIVLDGQPQPAPTGGGMESIIMIVALIAIFYFFMIRPQQKRQKKIREFRNKLEKGSKVITAGGIYGKVREIKENTIVVEISDNVKVTLDKGSVYPSAEEANNAVQENQNK